MVRRGDRVRMPADEDTGTVTERIGSGVFVHPDNAPEDIEIFYSEDELEKVDE